MATNLPPPLNFPNFRAEKCIWRAIFFLSHNTKLCVKSFAKRKTTHEFQVVSRCKSAVAGNIGFAVFAKSFATLLFEYITKENREVGIALGQ